MNLERHIWTFNTLENLFVAGQTNNYLLNGKCWFLVNLNHISTAIIRHLIVLKITEENISSLSENTALFNKNLMVKYIYLLRTILRWSQIEIEVRLKKKEIFCSIIFLHSSLFSWGHFCINYGFILILVYFSILFNIPEDMVARILWNGQRSSCLSDHFWKALTGLHK